MCFERRGRQSFAQRSQRTKFAGGNPGIAVFGDDLGGALEIFGFEQVAHTRLPSCSLQKVIREATVFTCDARRSRLSTQASSQKTAEERMQTIFFAASVAGNGHENIA